MSNNKLNDQVVESVTAVDTLLAGMAPASSAGMLDAVSAESFGVAMHSAVSRQQQSHILSSASVTSACARMLQAFPPVPVNITPGEAPVPPLKGTVESEIKEDSKQAKEAVDRLEKQIAELEKNASVAKDKLAALKTDADDPSGSKPSDPPSNPKHPSSEPSDPPSHPSHPPVKHTSDPSDPS